MTEGDLRDCSTNSEEQAGHILRDDRLEWSRPVLKRLNLNGAETGLGIGSDGFGKS